ncbi:MAG: class IV adenylate cyclase [Patescibacteria group bacterium]|nr:class IV adenylate cyclase [Patescibacteria group bacterium]
MKEVEVKIKVADINKAIRILKDHGCVLGAPVKQRDIVYIPNEIPDVPVPAGTNVLRIRQQVGKSIFTLKRSDQGNHLSKLEREVEIFNKKQMHEIIKLLEFKVIADITKIRRKGKVGEYEICADKVKELGDFLEIEHLTDKDPNQAQKKMLGFLQSCGIDTSQREMVGYDVLYVQKFGIKSQL